MLAATPLALIAGAALAIWLDRPLPSGGSGSGGMGASRTQPSTVLPAPVVGATSETPVNLVGPVLVRTPGLQGGELLDRVRARLSAELCQVCGDGIEPGGTYLKGEDGSRWHKRCHAGRPACGMTGRPIPNGAATVEVQVEVQGEVQGEVFLADAYDRAATCLATGLPLDNRGEFVINPRTGTKVLASALRRTRRCVSCQDQLLSGWDVGGVGFSCATCATDFKANVEGKLAALTADLGEFLEGEGLRAPPVEAFLASNEDGLTQTERGLCQTGVTTHFGSTTYEHRILLLSHLSREVTLVVLCHELMHAVVARAGVELETNDEEGLCELAAWRFAKARGFARHVLAGIEENDVDAYREGFLRQRAKQQSLAEFLVR